MISVSLTLRFGREERAQAPEPDDADELVELDSDATLAEDDDYAPELQMGFRPNDYPDDEE